MRGEALREGIALNNLPSAGVQHYEYGQDLFHKSLLFGHDQKRLVVSQRGTAVIALAGKDSE